MIWIIVDIEEIEELNETRPAEWTILTPVQDNQGRWVVCGDILTNPGNWNHYQAYLLTCEATNLEVTDFPNTEIK